MRRIFIDIETIPGESKPDPSEIKAPANYKNPDTIRAYQESAVDDAWRSQSLDSIKGRIVCIGLAFDKGPVRAFTGEERDIMKEFTAFVAGSMTLPELIGFNIRSFDLLWLRHRAYKYGLDDLAAALPWQRYDKRIVDLREIWTGGNPQGKGTLDEIARFLGLEGKTGDGSHVFDMWQAGNFDGIAVYCCKDVELTREVWKRMHPREATMLGGYQRETQAV